MFATKTIGSRSSKMKGKKWIVKKKFNGFPNADDFELQEEDIPEIKDGEFLCEATIYSIDPYMRLFGNNEGSTMIGEQIARVLLSKHPDFPVGSMVAITSGARSHSVSDGSNARPLPKFDGLPESLALGVLGMPGGTAYFGLHEAAKIKQGEVIFINGSSGMVGSVAGQLAKLQGCTVIGCASTQEKMDFLKELGYDHVFNYKTDDLDQALTAAAPEGIDVFFDLVGSPDSCCVIKHLKKYGRMFVCGTLAGYNDKEGPGTNLKGNLPFHDILMNELTVTGFTFWSYIQRRAEAEQALYKLIQEGKLRYKETTYTGMDQFVQAFLDMTSGKHNAKIIVTA